MNNNKVSVITPVYNSEKFIAETIQSVLNQTYTDWELILIDDCSTDTSHDVIKKYKDERIKYIRLQNNSGPAIARNKGIEMAEGRYIAFLDSDDIWYNEKLIKQVEFMTKKNAAISHTAYEIIDINSNKTGKIIRASEKINYKQLLNYNYIGCLTGMYDIEKTGKVFMPEINKRQDYALWLTILRQGHTAYFLNEVLAAYRIGRESVSSNKFDTAKYNWHILRNIEQLPFLKALWHFSVYSFLGLKKYYLN